jgi:hypothetical protein
MVLSYNGVYLWKKGCRAAKSFEVEQVVAELRRGISFDGPGGKVTTQRITTSRRTSSSARPRQTDSSRS